jgi:hypothetical protein
VTRNTAANPNLRYNALAASHWGLWGGIVESEKARRKALKYIAEMAIELKKMAAANNAGALACILDMAALEAKVARGNSRLNETIRQTPDLRCSVAANANKPAPARV